MILNTPYVIAELDAYNEEIIYTTTETRYIQSQSLDWKQSKRRRFGWLGTAMFNTHIYIYACVRACV
jgi:hypothetical protein